MCWHIDRFNHDAVIKWKHFPRYWPFVRGIHRSPVKSPHKGQWRRALMISLICAWINVWVNDREAGGLRRHRAHYNVTVMIFAISQPSFSIHIFFWNLLSGVQLTSQHWFRLWLGAKQATSHYLNQCWLRPLTHLSVTRALNLWPIQIAKINVDLISKRIVLI